MKRLKNLWPFIAPVICGLFNIVDLLLPDNIIANVELQNTLSHLFWLGNVCWYLGIPITVIYLIIKVQELEQRQTVSENYLENKIKGNDEWLVSQIKRLDQEVGKCVKVFQPGK